MATSSSGFVSNTMNPGALVAGLARGGLPLTGLLIGKRFHGARH